MEHENDEFKIFDTVLFTGGGLRSLSQLSPHLHGRIAQKGAKFQGQAFLLLFQGDGFCWRFFLVLKQSWSEKERKSEIRWIFCFGFLDNNRSYWIIIDNSG